MMGRLSESDQKLFITRLQQAEDAYNKASSAQAKAEAEASKARAEAEAAAKKLADHQADSSLVEAQMDYLKSFLSEDDAKRLEGVATLMQENTPGSMHKAFGRVVQACSRALAGASNGRPSKRRATEAPAAAVAPASGVQGAPASAAAHSSANLRNLLRSQFDRC